jgi:predicted ATP-dependent serine protease
MIPRYTSLDPDGTAETEADHFGNCPVCGAYRDLGELLAHVHDQERRSGAAAPRPFALDLNAKPASKPSRNL